MKKKVAPPCAKPWAQTAVKYTLKLHRGLLRLPQHAFQTSSFGLLSGFLDYSSGKNTHIHRKTDNSLLFERNHSLKVAKLFLSGRNQASDFDVLVALYIVKN